MQRRTLTIAIVLVLLLFGSPLILIVLFNGIVQALAGLAIIAFLAMFQIPILLLLKRYGPKPEQPADEHGD